jgi:hypothetical protein
VRREEKDSCGDKDEALLAVAKRLGMDEKLNASEEEAKGDIDEEMDRLPVIVVLPEGTELGLVLSLRDAGKESVGHDEAEIEGVLLVNGDAVSDTGAVALPPADSELLALED